MRAAFYTLGCKLNQFETEALASAFRSRGFFIAPWDEEADLYIINTCTVTSKSEQKARRIIRKINREHENAVVIITGCYVELEEEKLQREFTNAVLVPQHKKPMLLYAAEHLSVPISGETVEEISRLMEQAGGYGPFAYGPKGFQFHSRAYIKIQDGCNNRCAYCRVPLARGDSVSIDPQQAFLQLLRLEEEGYAEAVITGVNVTSYSFGDFDLAELIRFLLTRTERIRLRVSSLEPDMIGHELCNVLAASRIRPHFHIPVQSGSDKVLRLMKRKYNTDIVKKAFGSLREVKEDPFIAADIIVGFPGEEEIDYQQTRSLIRELAPAQLHVFQFSPRPGTAAYTIRPKVPEREAKGRSAELRRISDQLHRDYAGRWSGSSIEGVVIRAGRSEEGNSRVTVLTENYLEITAENSSEAKLSPGDSCFVSIAQTGEMITGRL